MWMKPPQELLPLQMIRLVRQSLLRPLPAQPMRNLNGPNYRLRTNWKRQYPVLPTMKNCRLSYDAPDGLTCRNVWGYRMTHRYRMTAPVLPEQVEPMGGISAPAGAEICHLIRPIPAVPLRKTCCFPEAVVGIPPEQTPPAAPLWQLA